MREHLKKSFKFLNIRVEKASTLNFWNYFILHLISSHPKAWESFLFYSWSASISEYKRYKKFYPWSACVRNIRTIFFRKNIRSSFRVNCFIFMLGVGKCTRVVGKYKNTFWGKVYEIFWRVWRVARVGQIRLYSKI